MKITVFTSNQPRHVALINSLSDFADETFAFLECSTLLPGIVPDFYSSSPTMGEYMNQVRIAELAQFKKRQYILPRAQILPMKSGDLSYLPHELVEEALQSDFYLVFGSSYIKGWLIDFLVEQGAFNIHMGLSPYYRGSSCNFWAMYDSLPNYVGATIHHLSAGLDSGPIIFHSTPTYEGENVHGFTMKAVKKAQEDLLYFLANKSRINYKPVQQDKSVEIRYTRKDDFTDEIAKSFLDRNLTPSELEKLINKSRKPDLIHLAGIEWKS